MDKLIEAITMLIPFDEWFVKAGLCKDLSDGFSILVSAVLVYLIVYFAKEWNKYRLNKKTATDLSPYFEYPKVKQSRELFIQTQGQSYPPTHEDEPSKSTRFIVKKPLIAWFINEAFNEEKENDKFYLILADSGMGKTTFMINLYVKYQSQFGKKHKIKLLPFGDNRIINKLVELSKNQEDAKNTILLLDAFDEYKGLLPPEEPDGLNDDERFRKRLDEIVELTRDFREVVITSRTQYFPGQEDQPYELKIPRFDEKGFHTLGKMYVSPFSKDEIRRYLNKKYGLIKFWNRKKKQIAGNIVENSLKLMVRPMLLSYIDYLVDSRQVFKTTYQIYETLIEKWIDREATKRKHDSPNREKFRADLFEFSRQIALLIYKNMAVSNTLSVDKETAIALCKEKGFNLEGYEITGQSLLTRDARHNWKFAHKSIFEFFLAREAIEDIKFNLTLQHNNFAGMDMAKTFYFEVGNMVFIKGGTFKLGGKFTVKVNDFLMSRFQVTQAEYKKITGQNPSRFADNEQPVEQVSWIDAVKYCNLMNKKADYSPVYDDDGNLLDPYGIITSDITKVIGFRLPTEAEWEYAAGGGENNRTEYAGTNSISDLENYAWYEKNSPKKTHPVGQLKPNQLGLYDMSGNVWEWCTDWYEAGFFQNNMENPVNCTKGSRRVLRGGAWDYSPESCRMAGRDGEYPELHWGGSGFRLVFVFQFTKQPEE